MSYTPGAGQRYQSNNNYRSIKNYAGSRGIVSQQRSASIARNSYKDSSQNNEQVSGSGSSNSVLTAQLKTYSKIAMDSADDLQTSGDRLTETGENSLFGKAEKSESTKYVVSEAKDFVNNYNNVMSSIKKLGGSENKKYAAELASFAEKNKADLEKIGITVLKDGSLQMNKSEMEKASLEDLKKVFNGKDSFADKVTNLADDIEENVEKKLKENLMTLGMGSGSNNYKTNNSSGKYVGNFFNTLI